MLYSIVLVSAKHHFSVTLDFVYRFLIFIFLGEKPLNFIWIFKITNLVKLNIYLWDTYTLATSCEELTHWKRLWCWEGLGAGGEWDDRGWDGWMASLTRWTWVWVNSGSWWWTGRPGVLQFMGSQRVGHDWATELNWMSCNIFSFGHGFFYLMLLRIIHTLICNNNLFFYLIDK